MPIVLKYLITAAIVVLVSEVAKRSDKIGALIAALPVVTSIAMLWMFVELKGDEQVERIGSHAWYTFWYVLPTLPMFLVIPSLLKKGMHFGWVMLLYALGTMVLFVALHLVMKKLGFPLM
ncbi:DUF3147 family protein [Rubritalea marina]|uniref:DUF3147 family protein n=1 Tax=Rubritalea marina TaxID=361055 RepID=UPI000372B898|nr:DUF3147 family protein [Rubritalea marina]